MSEAYKILGQSSPAATTETDVYTVPASTEAVISTIVICNRSTATTFRLYVAANGAAAANNQYLVYDADIAANDTWTFTSGLTLDAADVLRFYAGSANLTINVFGTEIT